MTPSIRFPLACVAGMFALAGNAVAVTSTFEELPLPASGYYFPAASTPFISESASFNHDYSDFGIPDCCWSGWTYSNQTDVTTASFTNQYSAFAGSGAGGSANYAVAYLGTPVISFASPVAAQGVYITNTTYTALSMRDGDAFAKKFGGVTGNDADFLTLTITGFDSSAQSTGSVNVNLADYRFSDNSQDYLLSQWAFVDLTSLGVVSSLGFTMTSSDVGDFGMNTPAYFALDNLSVAAVPEANTLAMTMLGLFAVGAAVRSRVARKG